MCLEGDGMYRTSQYVFYVRFNHGIVFKSQFIAV